MEKKIAIVTGASRNKGIGSAICRAFASEGADIFFTHWTPYDQTQDYGRDRFFPALLKEQLLKHGVRVGEMSINLAEPDAPKYLLDSVQNTLGEPTILVNNATHCEAVTFTELSAEVLDMHYAVNVRGTCMLSTYFVKRYGRQGARIINLVSGQDKTPMPGNIAYQTTKGAISMFTQCLAREAANLGVTVNAIDPGPTDSGWMDEGIKEFLLPKFPMGRIGTPDDAAKLITFLATDDAQWITGQIIHSDGGFWD